MGAATATPAAIAQGQAPAQPGHNGASMIAKNAGTTTSAPYSRGSPSAAPARWPVTLPDTQPSQSATPEPTRMAASRSPRRRSEEHTSELQSLMRISYAVFCLKKKKKKKKEYHTHVNRN